jgi:hypothetical protein
MKGITIETILKYPEIASLALEEHPEIMGELLHIVLGDVVTIEDN